MVTVGELLKNERVKRQLTLDDVEKKTKIRRKYLEAIENNDWTIFHSKTYIYGVISNYGRLFSLEKENLIAVFRREYEQKETVQFKKRVGKNYLTPEAQKIVRRSVFILSCLITLYFGYQLYLFFSPPSVEILSPTKSVFTREDKIELVGKAPNESVINVNGRQIFSDKENIFKTYVPLTEKNNPVTIEVIGANGKKTIIKKVFIKK